MCLYLSGLCVCISMGYVSVSQWVMCLYLNGLCVCISVGYVSVSQWVMCLSQWVRLGARGIGMWRKLKCVTTTLSSCRKPAVTSICCRDRKCMEVYLRSHTIRLCCSFLDTSQPALCVWQCFVFILLLLGRNVKFLRYKSRSETLKWLPSDLCDWRNVFREAINRHVTQ